MTASSSREALSTFLSAEPLPLSEPEGTHLAKLTASQNIDPTALLNGLVRALQLGKLGRLASALRLTSDASENLSRTLSDAMATNAFGLALPGISLPERESSLPSAGPDRKLLQSLQRIDRGWIGECLNAMIKDHSLLEVWADVLRGFDPATGVIAAESEGVFRVLLERLPQAIQSSSDGTYVVRPVADVRLSTVESKLFDAFIAGSGLARSGVGKVAMSVPSRWLRAGVIITKRDSGRRVITGVALLAIVAAALHWHIGQYCK